MAIASSLALGLSVLADGLAPAFGAGPLAGGIKHTLGSAVANPITEFPIPNSNTGLWDIAAGPDGNLWFTGYSSNTIGRITPGGTITATFSIPTANSYPTSIAVGPDGNLWFIESGANNVGRITTAGVITEFPMANFNINLEDITAGPDGNVWFIEGAFSQIHVITPTGSYVALFRPRTISSLPLGIVAGPDGNLWFTESQGNKIGRITTAGVITEFAPATVTSVLGPRAIAAGPDGNLWFTEATNQIGRITTAGAITEFPIPAGVVPTDITAGPDGNLWFTQPLNDEIGRITNLGVVTEFPVPPASSAPVRLTAGPDGNLWFTEQFGNQIGRITTAGVITEFAIPGQPVGITAGPDGSLWFTEVGQIGRITTAGTFSELGVPTAGNYSAGIATGPDGNLWFTESAARRIGRITTAGVATEFPTGPSPPSAAGAWLNRLNVWRASSNLSLLSETSLWSQGDYNHSLYMVKNRVITHYEDPSLPYYTVAGDLAARNSNLLCCGPAAMTDDGAIDTWMGTVLHALDMVDPGLTSTGFGSYRESTAWPGAQGDSLDVLRGNLGGGAAYPVFFPGPGSTEPLTTYNPEGPVDPLQSCTGYTWPAGIPVYVQVGAGVATTISAHSFTGNGAPLDHCVVDTHDPSVGIWLASHGAALLIPKQPLQPGVSYLVSLTVNGVPYTWSFGVSADNSISTPNVGPQDIAAGPDGNLWFTEGSANQIGRVTPAGAVTVFPLPPNSAPHGITAGPDGSLWFTESLGNKIGRITTAGVITEFPIPTPSSGPHDITAGPDGNLWFTESFGNKVGLITTAGVITEFSVPTAGSEPGGIAAGADGNLWFTESTATGLGAANIGRITPSGSITEFPTPTPNSAPVDIASGPDGNIWFTEQSTNQIGRITINTGLRAPGIVGVMAGDGEATLTWTPPVDGGPPITGYTVTALPGGAKTTVSPIVPAATVTGLTNGTSYTFTVAAINSIGTGPPSSPTVAVTPTAVAQNALVAVLPAMSNNAYGGYLTTAYLQNTGSSPAHIRVQYFNTTGQSVGFGNSAAGLAPGATWTVRSDNGDSLGAMQPGLANVYSDQPLGVFVNEFAPGGTDATSYTSISTASGTASTIFAPTIVNNAYGGYTTGIGLVNLASTTVTITVTYRAGAGGVVKTQTLPGIAAGSYQGLYSGDATLNLPAGFAGTASITSSGGNLAAVVNEVGPGNQFSSYDAVPAGSTTVYAPAALRNAYGGYNTGMGIQNTTGTAGTVTITYYNGAGQPSVTTHAIAANGYQGIYQGTDIPADGAYTAKITSTVAIAGIVNEVAAVTNPLVQQSTAYDMFATGSPSQDLPLVESGGSDGWSTGEGIMNTGAAATTVTVTYYDAASGLQVGTPDSLLLQPNAFWGLYQPNGGLPAGDRASAVVTASGGGQVAVICNESNATSFMSYSGE